MKRAEPPLLEQLIEARRNILNQIDKINAGPSGPSIGTFSSVRRQLENLLQEIEEKIIDIQSECSESE